MKDVRPLVVPLAHRTCGSLLFIHGSWQPPRLLAGYGRLHISGGYIVDIHVTGTFQVHQIDDHILRFSAIAAMVKTRFLMGYAPSYLCGKEDAVIER